MQTSNIKQLLLFLVHNVTAFWHCFIYISVYLDHYAGLEKVIEILRRAGKLEECTKFLDMAEKSSGRASIDAGFNYCKGLYEWSVCS